MTNGDIAATLTASSGKSASQSGPSVMQKCYGISSYESNAMKSQNPSSGIYEADKARTLDTSGGNPACNQGGIAVTEAKMTKTIGIATQSYYDMKISDKGATYCRFWQNSRQNPNGSHQEHYIVCPRWRYGC